MEENQIEVPQEARGYSVPWSIIDTWLGIVLLIMINVGLLVALFLFRDEAKQFAQGAGVVLAELIYLLPVLVIFAFKRIHPRFLGFEKFDLLTMGLGCGLIAISYPLIIAHNLLLTYLGVNTQGEAMMKMFSELKSPVWLFATAVIVAPLVEEIFFRGFLFQGFRQRYGWIAALLLSSGIFAAAHLDPVSFIPTFILGAVLGYVYHRSNSLWPSVILHLLNNGFAMCAMLVAMRFPELFPS
ncbi:MAG: type II CAAX endopeptidase family protein [Anaerolineaceae bacterium]|nr:type II CAAX endopeptidase family protein [Anaerolineaceae bacterium]